MQIADRYHAEYVDGTTSVLIAADLDGPIVVLHPQTSDLPLAVERIVEGLQAMGEEVVIGQG